MTGCTFSLTRNRHLIRNPAFLLRKLSLRMSYLLLASWLGENKWENCVDLEPLPYRRQDGQLPWFCFLCVMSLNVQSPVWGSRHFTFVWGVECCRREPCILLCHSGISLPLLVLIILYKIEVTGEKHIVAPASRKAACVAESNKANNATAAPGFLRAELHFGWQNRCSLLQLRYRRCPRCWCDLAKAAPWPRSPGYLITSLFAAGSEGRGVAGTQRIRCEWQDARGSWEEMNNRRKWFTSHRSYQSPSLNSTAVFPVQQYCWCLWSY